MDCVHNTKQHTNKIQQTAITKRKKKKREWQHVTFASWVNNVEILFVNKNKKTTTKPKQ